MGLFSKNKKKKLKTQPELEMTNLETFDLSKVAYKSESEEEWVWIEGYKGFNSDFTCQPDKDVPPFQYEIGGIYSMDADVELCISGFHFCTKLNDVLNKYYNLCNTHKFAKVKGLVKKSDFDKIDTEVRKGIVLRESCDSKLAAKQIEILEELTFEDLKEYVVKKYPTIENEEQYNKYADRSYIEHMHKLLVDSMVNYGYTELFSHIYLNQTKTNSISTYNQYYYVIKARADKAIAFMQEGVSKDMAVYLLMTQDR